MSEDLLNLIRREVALYLANRAETRIGVVQSYDPALHAARVEYQPEGELSGWIPVGTVGAGNGFGMGFAPTIGQQVTVHFLEGSLDSGIIGPSIHSTVDLPPPGVASGMAWMIDPSGTSILLTNDGNAKVSMTGNLSASIGGDLSATVDGDASLDIGGNLTTQADTWSHTGNLTLTGNVTVTESVTAGTVITE
jgi:uncharacterized protein involved in type VI secretion and phage assembly